MTSTTTVHDPHTAPAQDRSAKRATIAAALVVILLTMGYVWQALVRFEAMHEAWLEHSEIATKAGNALVNFDRQLGYGGLIHNFKNLVLRQDLPRYEKAIDGNLDRLKQEATTLEGLLRVPEDLASVAVLRATVAEYEAKFGLLKSLIAQGRTTREIDAAVKVSDTAALQAMGQLVARTRQRADAAALRANKIKADASRLLLVGGAVLLLVIGFATWLLLRLQRSRAAARAVATEAHIHVETLLDNAPDAMVHVTADGHVVRANRMAEVMFGYSAAELTAIHVDTLLPERFRAAPTGQSTHFSAHPVYLSMGNASEKLMVLTKDGRELQVEISLGSSGAGDDMIVTATLRDVTQQAALRAALEQATKEANAANQAKSGFLATMSHELRTPMNAILGMLELLLGTELTVRQHDYASKTQGAARSLLVLLNDILDFSKIEAGKMTLENSPFRLDQLLHDLAPLLSANVGAKELEVLFDVDATLPEVVAGDSMRLQQVLLNLGGNAIKFTPKGQIVIALHKRSETSETSETPGTVTIAFSVRDTGIGIAPENLVHIFGGFAQAEDSTTRRYGGTGLGLAICKRFVELMGGDITVDSTVGTGSTFAFDVTLPLVTQITQELVAPERPVTVAPHVLVVDDNRMAAELIGRMVASWGADAELADTGAQALEMIAAQHQQAPGEFPFPVVYVDWQMEQMDGFEATRQIRQFAQQHQLAQPLVIMVSAHGRDTLALRSKAEQDLLDGFLVKPVTAPMLFDVVMEARAGSSNMRRMSGGRSSKRRLTGMRILVVEDNLLNQQVAEELLSAEAAIVSLAANGRLGADAVAAAAPPFDIVLMDIQMPVLDGYGATRVIRDELGFLHLPIVAMTANVMASDRQACLAAGMNEHVGKPIDMAAVVPLLLELTGFKLDADLAVPDDAASEQVPAVPDVPGLKLRAALARMSGMRPLYVRTARDFCKVLDSTIAQVQQQLAAGEMPAVLMALHTVKGNAGTLGATELADKAAALELLCKSGAANTDCSTALDGLATVIASTQDRLRQAIAHLAPAAAPAPAPQDVKVDVALALATLRELDALAVAADLEVLARFTVLRESIAGLPDGFCDALDDAMQNLELDTVHVMCRDMAGKLAA